MATELWLPFFTFLPAGVVLSKKKITKKDLNFRGHLLILQAWSPSHFFEKHMGLQAGHLRTAATWTAHRQTMQARDLHRTDAAPQFSKNIHNALQIALVLNL